MLLGAAPVVLECLGRGADAPRPQCDGDAAVRAAEAQRADTRSRTAPLTTHPARSIGRNIKQLIDREDEACGLADNLAAGKDGPYFRRLRAYCLFKAGDKAGAQLAYDLTAEQAKDDIYKRLMGAAVTGGPPGEASLRNGIEYALSRRLGLDLTPAIDKAWAPVVTTIEGPAKWWPAEGYHQEYWEGEGQRNPYCLAVIPPKLAKLRKKFAGRLKA